jgi:hypothetical protein
MVPMVPMMSLWLPILVSTVIVFIASSIIHMMLPYHKSDFRKLPGEDDVMDALRKFNLPPGDYMMPCAGSGQEMKSAAFKEKFNKGPVAIMTLMPAGQWTMGPQLVQWFIYCGVIGVFCAYLAGHVVMPGTIYLPVFRVVGTVAFCCYAMAVPPGSIWYKRSWRTTLVSMFDGLIYACLTAGTFGWLWPKA